MGRPISFVGKRSCSRQCWRLSGAALLCLLLSPLFILWHPSNAHTKELEHVTLQLKWHHQFQFAGYYAAKAKGFYKDEGLEVTIVEGGPDIRPDEEVTKGKAQYGILASEILPKRAAGAPIVCVAPIFQHSIRTLYVHANDGIDSPQDLVGLTIALNPNESIEILAMLRAEGVAARDINILNNTKNSLTQFLRREIDGLNGSIANQAWQFIRSGKLFKVLRPITYGIDFYGDCIFTSEKEAKEHFERALAFRRASIRGWQYAFAHPEEISELIVKRYNPTKSREALLYEAARIREITQPRLVEIGNNNPNRWQRIQETYAKQRLMEQAYNQKGFFLDEYKAPPLPEWVKWTAAGTSILLLLTLGMALLLALFNSRLKAGVAKRTSELAEANKKLATEVEQHKRAKQEISSMRKMLESFIDSMPSMIIGLMRDGTITHWNQKAAALVGIDALRATGANLTAIIPELEVGKRLVEKAIASSAPKHNHKVPLHIDGEKGWYDLTAYPLPDTVATNAVLRIDDVSDLMQMEQTLVQAEKMMSLDGLAAGIAHEINNPLGAIVQASQNITRRVSPTLKQNIKAAEDIGVNLDKILEYMQKRKIDHLLEGIKESGLRAADIIQNMLEFSRKSESGLAPTDIHTVLDHAVRLASADYDLKKRYDFKNISIRKEYGADIPLLMIARTELEQVILNLLRNAAQAMAPKDGASPGKPPLIDIVTTQQNDFVQIRITDNGPGMDEQTKNRIFDPFFTTKPPGEGTGLGLSVSYFIVTRNHGGRFEVETTEGEGTTFIISLPNPDEDYSLED